MSGKRAVVVLYAIACKITISSYYSKKLPGRTTKYILLIHIGVKDGVEGWIFQC
jgi:hypothetical protein